MNEVLKKTLSRLKYLLKRLIPIALLILITRYIVSDWVHLREVLSDMSPGWALLSALFFLTGTTVVAWNWLGVLRILGVQIGVLDSYRSYYYSTLVKYIPGRVWSAAGRIFFARQAGVPEGTAMLGIILESLLLMCSSVAVGFLSIGSFSTLPVEIRILMIVSPLIIVFLHPVLVHRGVRLLAGRFPDYVIELQNVPAFRSMITLFLRYCLVWILQGIGFWCALKALVDFPADLFLLCVGGNTLAWLAGFLVILTPAGLGVREIVLTRITAGAIGHGSAAMSAVLSRVAVISSELAGTLVVALACSIRTYRKNRSQTSGNPDHRSSGS